jgi:GntR family transcriptional regulator / MocR family aminotransferase
MHVVGWLPKGVSDKVISGKAAEQNLKVAAISAYGTKKLPRGGLILGYTAFGKNQIKEGVKKLKAILSGEISK